MSWFGSVYAESELPHRARAVYMYLKDRGDDDGKCWPSVKTIAADLKLSRRTVQRALADLEWAALIQRDERYRENGSRTSNLYSVK